MAKTPPVETARERVSPLIGKSAEIAAATKTRVLEMLGRYPDAVNAETAASLAEREADWEGRAYVHRRTQGYENDQFNKESGITLFLTTKEKDALLKRFKEWGYPVPEHSLYSGRNLWAIRLPEGGYGAGFGGIQFYGIDKTLKDGVVVEGERPFLLGYGNVVRVESDAGDLWQNVNFTPDGKVKSKRAE